MKRSIDDLANKTHKQIEDFREAYKIETGELLRERIRDETTGLFESKLFRETLMGLLTPREEQIAIYLQEACPRTSNDDWGLISMLVHRSDEEREAIRNKYIECHGADLIADIRSNCSGDYEDAVSWRAIAPKTRTLARAYSHVHVRLALLHEQDRSHGSLDAQGSAHAAIAQAIREGIQRQDSPRRPSQKEAPAISSSARSSLSPVTLPPGASNLSAPTTKFPVLRSSRLKPHRRTPPRRRPRDTQAPPGGAPPREDSW